MSLKGWVPIGLRMALKRVSRHIANLFDPRSYATSKCADASEFRTELANRESLIVKSVPAGWEQAQHDKETTLRIASPRVDGIVIPPLGYFSFWCAVGRPGRAKGYLPGMEIRGGELVRTVAGGICQLSNALCWVSLLAGFEIVERHRHGYDLFPDESRDVPFGSGATVLYPYKDLIVRNPFPYPAMIAAEVSGGYLRVAVRMTEPPPFRAEVEERAHRFYREADAEYRYNEIWRIWYDGQGPVGEEFLFENHARVLYERD